MSQPQLLPILDATIKSLKNTSVPKERKEILEPLIAYIQGKENNGEKINLNFICTHNSRRSQFSQIWAQTAAYYFGIEASCYSGGVEVTEFNERAVGAIKRAGFRIYKKRDTNPAYFISFSDATDPIAAFSKRHDDAMNAQSNFAAVMTCSHADENCPFIPGAEARLPILYEDPKKYDDTPLEVLKYDERSKQIAIEMFYVFSNIKHL